MKRLALKFLGVACATTMLVTVAAVPAAAMDTRQGQSITVAAGQTVSDDLYVAANSIDIAGTVDGDLVAAGNSITISGVVTHDVLLVGNEMNITGEVDGSIRAMGGTVTIAGPVKGDVVVAGGTVNVTSAASLGRDLALVSGTATITGPVARNAQLAGGDITLANSVGGDVNAAVGALTVSSGASIAGHLKYSADQAVNLASGATVQNGVERVARPARFEVSPAAWALGAIQGLIGVFLFGLILLFVFPGFSASAAPTLARRPWESLGIGFALLVGVPVVCLFAFLAGLVVGGWWISLLVLGLYVALMAAGYALGGYATGRLLLHLLGDTNPNRVLALIVGVFTLWAIGLIPVIGWMVGLAAVVFGLGALVVAAWTSRFGGGGTAAVEARTPVAPLTQAPMPT